MDFRIADTFTDSLARLSGDEQKAVKTTAFDLQMHPATSGMSLHKLEKSRDRNFWSVRVNADIRLIVHKTEGSLLLCYVNHHDKAYDWAERRKLETHPKTGAAQLVEIRETVKEIMVPRYVDAPAPVTAPMVKSAGKTKATGAELFLNVSDDELLCYGVPPEWLKDVRGATEDSILTIASHLPDEASEALLELATGGAPRVTQVVAKLANPFDHPDAQRRFRVMTNLDELKQALDYPWEKWTVFLHPEQRQLVVRTYNGPARVAGSAGTGKTIVALHRATHLARSHSEGRVLLTTFSNTLASALHTKLKRLLGTEPRLAERIEVCSLESIGLRLYKTKVSAVKLVTRAELRAVLQQAVKEETGHKFSLSFVMSEWEQVVDAWQLRSWEAYRDVARLGRKTRLPEAQRRVLWAIMERVRKAIVARGVITPAEMFTKLAEALGQERNMPFDFVVVDEAQDVGVAHLRFLAALGAGRVEGLFFAGDLGQRIFQPPFSWKSLGVDLRGRSRVLRVNYRTSHQIRMQADRLLGGEVTDVDGNKENRNDTVSVFNGPAPTLQVFATEEKEAAGVATWLLERIKSGVAAHEIGIFVRSDAQLNRALGAITQSGLPHKQLDANVETTHGHVSLCTMHLAKGLEFRAVAVMACDDEIIPLQERIETVGDEADLEDVYDTERQLLYVACTRARDYLFISAKSPASEFLDDLKP